MVADTGGQGLRSSGDGVDGQLTVTQVLPDGDTVLGHVGESAAGEAVLISLGRGEVRRLLPGKFPWYLDSGLIVFRRAEALWAVPFDVGTGTTTGRPAGLPPEALVRFKTEGPATPR